MPLFSDDFFVVEDSLQPTFFLTKASRDTCVFFREIMLVNRPVQKLIILLEKPTVHEYKST